MTTNRYIRRSVNLDDNSHNRCKALADEMTLSISGVLRILIKQAHEHMISEKQGASQSYLQT